jgi:Protein of unknown function (DUF3703)
MCSSVPATRCASGPPLSVVVRIPCMTADLRSAYVAELASASDARADGDIERAFQHLGRAHIISQRFTWQHVHVHWLMLKLGASMGDWREIRGQLSRIFAAAIFSRIWVPVGNTGRANVSALTPMPMPDDLRILMERSGV